MSAEAESPVWDAQASEAAKRYAALAAYVAWTSALDTLEAAADAAEVFLDDPVGNMLSGADIPNALTRMDWLPPVLEGQLPAGALARANALAARQANITRRLAEARRDVLSQLQAVSSIPGIGEPAAAIYLDVKG